MKNIHFFSIVILTVCLISIFSAGCTNNSGISPDRKPGPDINATALSIALQNATVQSYLAGGYTIQNIGPAMTGINDVSLNMTGVQFDTPQDIVGVNVDVKNGTIVYIWTLPKRMPVSPGS